MKTKNTVNPKEHIPVRGYFRKRRRKKFPLKLIIILAIAIFIPFLILEYKSIAITILSIGIGIYIAVNWKKWKRNLLHKKLHELEETERDQQIKSQIEQLRRKH